MSIKSKYELAIVGNSILIRTTAGKSQSYVAMILDVSEGYIGHVENPNRPEMYTHDQINAIAIDLDVSIHSFYPDQPIIQPLSKRNGKIEQERQSLIKLGIDNLINSDFLHDKKSINDIIAKLEDDKILEGIKLTNKDVTDILRPIVKSGNLKSEKIGSRNLYNKLK